MKPPPPGWPRLSETFSMMIPRRLSPGCAVFLDSRSTHDRRRRGLDRAPELVFGGAVVMVPGTGGNEPWQQLYRSPRSSGR